MVNRMPILLFSRRETRRREKIKQVIHFADFGTVFNNDCGTMFIFNFPGEEQWGGENTKQK
ncbi:MAG TPA: hypothetical protein DDW65_04945 [Firmicutes bacterium]|jgi:hypothetical protein|nr:hypothetical protein [Bacillota bacterium]